MIWYQNLYFYFSCTGVGRTGWHIDGSFMPKPFSHSIYHIIECPKKGATVFLPLTELIEVCLFLLQKDVAYETNIS